MTLIDKAEALLPCPFCGGEAELWNAHDNRPAWIACMGRCAVLVSKEHTTDAEAIAAWNRRAALPARGVGEYTLAPHLQKIAEGAKTAPQWDTQADRLAPTDAAQVREAATEAMTALSWAKANLQALSCRVGNEGAEFPIVDRALASLFLALIGERT